MGICSSSMDMKVLQCSGYHVSLTQRRSPVQVRVRPLFSSFHVYSNGSVLKNGILCQKCPLLLRHLLDGLVIARVRSGRSSDIFRIGIGLWLILVLDCVCLVHLSGTTSIYGTASSTQTLMCGSCYPTTQMGPLECYCHRWYHSWPRQTLQP